MAQQTTTTGPLLPLPPPSSSSSGTTTGQSTSPSLTSPLSSSSLPLTPQEQEQINRLQNVIAATNLNLDETEKQIGGIVYTPRWSDPVWVEPDSSAVLVAYCLPGEFAESGQEILGGGGGFELEVLESYEVALPQNFTAWMMVIGNEDRQNRYPAAVGVICASDANNAETRVVSPQEQQQINNVVQQFSTTTSIDQVINIINNNNNATNQNATGGGGQTAPPPGGSSSSGVGGITISDLDIEFLPSDLTGVDVRAETTANTYNGPCPVTAEISATITDNIGNRDVTYRLIRSDGGVPGEAAIHFDQPGSEIALFDSDITTSFQGWAAIEITQPVQLQSNRVEFQITCTPGTEGVPPAGGGTDTIAPNLSVPVTRIIPTSSPTGEELVLYDVSATDNVDGTARLDANNMLRQEDNVGGSVTISCNPPSNTNFRLGDHTVQCSATDTAGNVGTASFIISVTSPTANTPPGGLSSGTITTSLSATPSTHNGPCPATITFSGTITDYVGNRDIIYRFIFSDGSVQDNVLHFNQPGSQSVSTTRPLGGGTESVQAWGAIQILQPNYLQSNRAEIEITCAPSTGGAPPPPPQTLQAENTTAAATDDDEEEDTTTDGAGAGGTTGGGGTGDTDNADQSPPAGTTTTEGAGAGGTTGGGGTAGGTGTDGDEPSNSE